jgi:exopolysaccharide biosynthesis polyprenyl glycosylphosphotransferase
MEKIRVRLNYALLILLCVVSLFVLVSLSYAGTHPESAVHAPEPGSVALITTGIAGWIVQFARKRFQEFKRAFDIVVAVSLLILTAPLMAMAMVLIKIVSPGPVFYRQERVGLKGKIFQIYKLRTMKLNAEKETGPIWAKENDPRLIKFGAIIRKTHIDEIPQLINVLKGEMSMIGPRPERPFFVRHLDKEIPDYQKRLAVKPGITGLAQVLHKYDETIEDVKRKVKFDLLYIRKMCLMVDMRILGMTVVSVLTGKGAR